MENMEGVVEDNEESDDENEYDAAEDRYGGHDYPSDTESMKRMIANANATIDYSEDSDSSEDEEMTIQDYERTMQPFWEGRGGRFSLLLLGGTLIWRHVWCDSWFLGKSFSNQLAVHSRKSMLI
jgi:hypothetical protein